MILCSVMVPILTGILFLLLPEKVFRTRRYLLIMTGVSLVISAAFVVAVLGENTNTVFSCGELVDGIEIYFAVDQLGKLFAAIATVCFVLAGFFAFVYMKHERNEKCFFGFYLITFGVVLGLDFSGNLITMYLFYELMTLVSFPLVIHNGSREAIMAGLKYLFYSFAGAYMALFGIYFLQQYLKSASFVAGGSLNLTALTEAGNEAMLFVVVFFMILGFGVKAGLFPMHAWLPTAHPVAPAPASAVLSGIIVKGGILAIIRVVYYCVGEAVLQGTWVQTAWMLLALVTIVMGSALAYKEKVFKKRLAYSTVSNLSYILFGLALLQQTAMTGALLHVVFHAIMKTGLFLCAGAVIYLTGKTKIKDFCGMGKTLPCIFACFTVMGLGLIGIAPTSGIVSKWYLAIGALESDIWYFSWIGPIVLLISALLTAGYILSVTIQAYLPVESNCIKNDTHVKISILLLVPILILSILTLLFGLFPNGVITYCNEIASTLFTEIVGGV